MKQVVMLNYSIARLFVVLVAMCFGRSISLRSSTITISFPCEKGRLECSVSNVGFPKDRRVLLLKRNAIVKNVLRCLSGEECMGCMPGQRWLKPLPFQTVSPKWHSFLIVRYWAHSALIKSNANMYGNMCLLGCSQNHWLISSRVSERERIIQYQQSIARAFGVIFTIHLLPLCWFLALRRCMILVKKLISELEHLGCNKFVLDLI